MGGGGGYADLGLPRAGDGIRQRVGDPKRVYIPTASDCPELLHRLVGGGRSRGGDTRDAIQRSLPAAGQMDLRYPSVQAVADMRRALLHRQYPQFMRHRARPLLGDHRSDQLRSEAHPQASPRDDRRRVDSLRCDQLAAVGRLERLAGGIGTRHALPAH